MGVFHAYYFMCWLIYAGDRKHNACAIANCLLNRIDAIVELTCHKANILDYCCAYNVTQLHTFDDQI